MPIISLLLDDTVVATAYDRLTKEKTKLELGLSQ